MTHVRVRIVYNPNWILIALSVYIEDVILLLLEALLPDATPEERHCIITEGLLPNKTPLTDIDLRIKKSVEEELYVKIPCDEINRIIHLFDQLVRYMDSDNKQRALNIQLFHKEKPKPGSKKH